MENCRRRWHHQLTPLHIHINYPINVSFNISNLPYFLSDLHQISTVLFEMFDSFYWMNWNLDRISPLMISNSILHWYFYAFGFYFIFHFISIFLHSKNTRVRNWPGEISQLDAECDPELGQPDPIISQVCRKLTNFRVIFDPEWSLAPMDPFPGHADPGIFRVYLSINLFAEPNVSELSLI